MLVIEVPIHYRNSIINLINKIMGQTYNQAKPKGLLVSLITKVVHNLLQISIIQLTLNL